MAPLFVEIEVTRYPQGHKLSAIGNEPVVQIEYFNINHISHVYEGENGNTSFTLLDDERVYETTLELKELMEMLDTYYLDSKEK